MIASRGIMAWLALLVTNLNRNETHYQIGCIARSGSSSLAGHRLFEFLRIGWLSRALVLTAHVRRPTERFYRVCPSSDGGTSVSKSRFLRVAALCQRKSYARSAKSSARGTPSRFAISRRFRAAKLRSPRSTEPMKVRCKRHRRANSSCVHPRACRRSRMR